MKKIIYSAIIFMLLLSLASCSAEGKVILDNSENSKFIDFYTEGDNVYIECELNIYSERDAEVKISATDFDDVEAGLLKGAELIGIDKSDGDETFGLSSGENTVTVLFKGEYNGVYQISAREIPRFILIEKA